MTNKKSLLVPREKENKIENGQQQAVPLKGFALFMAEHREEWSGPEDQVQEAALAAWKALDKTEKEAFKLAR